MKKNRKKLSATNFQLPLFGIVNALSGGVAAAIFLRCGNDLFLPLFTSSDNAASYVRRASMTCVICKFPSLREVAAFIGLPPGPAIECDRYRIAVDPVSPEIREFFAFETKLLIKSFGG